MKNKDKVFSVEKAEDSTGFLLWQVTNLWQREIRKALEKYDLTHSQFVLIASILWLSSKGEIVTQILLSSHTKIDPMTTSTVLRTLERKGHLERKEHPVDTRAKTIALTSSGEKISKLAVKAVESFDKNFFSRISKLDDFNKKLSSLLEMEKDNIS